MLFVTSHVARHLLSGEHARLVVPGADAAGPAVGLGGAVGGRHAREAPPLHDAVEAAVLRPAEHVHPLAHREVGRGQRGPGLDYGILCNTLINYSDVMD